MGAGGHTENTEGDGADNVIRFPRDWFGSKDDLVPFGPAADRLEAAAAAQREQRRDDDLAGALTANDFWGESAGALHQPVGVPEVDEQLASEIAKPALRAVETVAAPAALVASPRRVMTLPSRGWLSGVAVVVMLICAVGIFLLGRTHAAPTAARGVVVHAAATFAPGINLSRQVDLLAARGMREAAEAVAVVERLRQPAPHRHPKAQRRAVIAEHIEPARHATATQAAVSPPEPVAVVEPTAGSDSSHSAAVTASSVTHTASSTSSSAKTRSSSAASTPPAQKSTHSTKQSSNSSSASSSLAPGPTTAGSAGLNCDPQCQ